MPKIIPYTPEYFAAYQDFARRGWGQNCYQQSARYLDWLYRDNPYQDPQKPFLIACAANRVVGAIHKIRLPWLIDGQKVMVSAIHNLLVEPRHRQGSGLMLITAALKGETNVLCPGVLPPLSNAYKMLRCQEIDALWFRKIISPLGAVLKKFGGLRLPPLETRTITAQEIRELSAAQSAELISALNKRPGSHPLWAEAVFRWRFLQGPKHIFLRENAGDFLILSIGRRKGLTVARIIDGNIQDERSTLWDDAVLTARRHGAEILLAYTADPDLKKYLRAKVPPLKKHPLVFFYHRDKKTRELNFNASAGDFGLEAGFREANISL